MNRRWVAAGIVGSAAQSLGVAAMTFISYRILYAAVGPDRFGAWAAVGALTLIPGIAELGMSGGALRYVALHLGRQASGKAVDTMQTAVLSCLTMVGLASLLLSPWIGSLLQWVWNPTSTHFLPEAIRLLRWTLALAVATAVQNVVMAGLDGAQRVAYRNAILVVGSMVGVGLTWLLVRQSGLVGFAHSLLVQSIGVSVAGWLLLRKGLPGLPVVPRVWRRERFRELVGYGIPWQGVTVVNLFADPLTKLLIGRYGGLPLLGLYEAATKVVMPLRGMVVSAQQAFLPTIARLSEDGLDRLRDLYLDNVRATTALVSVVLPSLILASPLASIGWLGHRDASFEHLFEFLSAVWFFNALSCPAYFSHLGRGHLGPVFANHAITALMVVLLGVPLAHLTSAAGAANSGWCVIVVSGLAIAVGSTTPTVALHRQMQIRRRDLFRSADRRVAAGAVSLMGGAILLAILPSTPLWLRLMAAAFGPLAIGTLLVQHPQLNAARRRVCNRSRQRAASHPLGDA